MALQTFTAGQVLTAAQVNALQTNDFNQTVSTKTANYSFLVGDRGTRVVGNGTSITFTVDNSIFSAGDTIKIHNINSTPLTIAAGAGVTINNAAGLTMVQWQEATLFATSASSFILFESTASSAQGLTLINTTSFSAVASQSLSPFSATYENYLLLINLTTNSANDGDIYFRLRSSTTDATTSYYWGRRGWTSTGVGTDGSSSNSSAITIMTMDAANVGNQHVQLNVFSPFLGQKTKVGWLGSAQTDSGLFYGQFGGGFLDNANSYDGFSIVNQNGTSTGKVSVYGYNF